MMLRASLLILLLISPGFTAEDRLEKVLGDRPKVESAGEGQWIYNDLPAALERGRVTGKPLLVVLRCVP